MHIDERLREKVKRYRNSSLKEYKECRFQRKTARTLDKDENVQLMCQPPMLA